MFVSYVLLVIKTVSLVLSYIYWKENFEDTKDVITSRKPKGRQRNGQQKSDTQRNLKHYTAKDGGTLTH